MQFPEYRARRLRTAAPLRRLLRETCLLPDHLVQAILVGPGKGREDAPRVSVERAVELAREAHAAGVPAVLLSGCAESKDAVGSGAWDERGPLFRAVTEIAEIRGLALFVEVGFARYTDHGRPGVVVDGGLDNDATIDNLCRAGIALAQAGAAALVPGGMLDGAVGNLREALDDEDGGIDTAIFGLVAHASVFDGGERGEDDGAIDPANAVEAIREASLDVGEGADAVLVRPALTALDAVARLRDELELPLGAWMGAAESALVGVEPRPLLESLLAARRAGADFVITPHALRAARALEGKRR